MSAPPPPLTIPGYGAAPHTSMVLVVVVVVVVAVVVVVVVVVVVAVVVVAVVVVVVGGGGESSIHQLRANFILFIWCQTQSSVATWKNTYIQNSSKWFEYRPILRANRCMDDTDVVIG